MKNFLILIACIIVAVLAYSYISKKNTTESSLTIPANEQGMNTNQESNTYGTSTTATSTPSVASSTTESPLSNKNKKSMNVTLKTNKGIIKIELFDSRVPNTTANFRKLAEAGFYNGVKFHRIIKGFMIQSGDPLTKDDSRSAEWGTGGPGYKFPDEITAENKNDVGTISMANAGPNTNGSQFFINVNPNNFLDGKHTVFGKVISGMDIVTEIENTPTDGSDRPLSPVIIESVSF